MNKSTRTVIAAAAMAGLYAGALALKASASVTNAGSAVVQHDDSKDGKSHDCKGQEQLQGHKAAARAATTAAKARIPASGKGGCKTN